MMSTSSADDEADVVEHALVADMTAKEAPLRIPYGKFGKPQGLQGAIRLYPYNADSTLLGDLDGVWVRSVEVPASSVVQATVQTQATGKTRPRADPGASNRGDTKRGGDDLWTWVPLSIVRAEKGHWVVATPQIVDRTEAERWVGREVLVAADLLPPLPEDEYYVRDLEGLQVLQEGSERVIGVVCAVHQYPAADCLEVRLTEGAVVEIPMHEPFLHDVMMTKRQVLVGDLLALGLLQDEP